MTVIRTLARPMLASMFVVGAVNALRGTEQTAQRAKKVTDRIVTTAHRVAPGVPIPQDAHTLVRINAAAQLLGAAGLVSGRAPRISSAVLAGSLVPTTLAGHAYWEEQDPQARATQKIHFFKNVSMLGGLLLAAVDTEGRPGVAWRARHAAKDVRREARHLRREARLEARIARKAVA
jgi:uncharacterized membrane protein YphA (DoxX/SURF4 family)